MKLYFFPIAPNPTRVRLYLAEKAAGGARIPIEEVPVNLIGGEQNAPEHLARNPFGAVPVLERDDGSYLIESYVIMEYLEERFPEPCLIGSEPEERATNRQIERVAELRVLHPAARLVHATRSPLGLPPNEELARSCREQLPRGLAWMEALLGDGRPFLAGERPTLGDGTLAAALQFGRFRELPEIDLAGYPQLARWDAAYRAREPARKVLLA